MDSAKAAAELIGEEDWLKSVKSERQKEALAESNWLFMPNNDKSICVIWETMLMNKSAGMNEEAKDKSIEFKLGKESMGSSVMFKISIPFPKIDYRASTTFD